MSLTMTPSVSKVYSLATSPVFTEMSPEDLKYALQASTDLLDNAARDLLASFDQEPAWNFAFLDLCKSIVARHAAMRRDKEFLYDKYGRRPIVVHAPGDESVTDFFTIWQRTAVFHFYMFKTGRVILAAASNVRKRDNVVQYLTSDLIPSDRAKLFLELISDYVKSLQTAFPDFNMQSQILEMLSAGMFRALLKLGNPKHLFLIPHRLLHILPLHSVFIDTPSKRIYLDHVCENISYCPSAFTLRPITRLHFKDCSTHPRKAKMLGIVDVTDPDLPGTQYELENLKIIESLGIPIDITTAVEQLPGDKRDYAYISWGAHGKSDPSSWGGSFIYLANRRFLAKDIAYSWELATQSTVTLAACETAVDFSVGLESDEYCGLDMAFCIAGAQSVFSTMWKVSDPVAALFSCVISACLIQGEELVKMMIGLQQALRDSTWHGWLLSDNQIDNLPEAARNLTRQLHDTFRKELTEIDLTHERYWGVFRHYWTH